ncbi:MAG: PKD domain-containing protein [Acidobacteria bacterium]|nr:PKD domain-containing protein [Acidobacteriota bacterium]
MHNCLEHGGRRGGRSGCLPHRSGGRPERSRCERPHGPEAARRVSRPPAAHRSLYNRTGFQASTWNWDFGDGTTSTEENPVHTYAHPGTYRVTLKVTNHEGQDETHRIVRLTQPPRVRRARRIVPGS